MNRRTLTLMAVAGLLAAGCEPRPETEGPERDPGADYRPEPQIRPEASGLHGAVAAGHPLAVAAGYEVLRAGGNAADAAVTMAAVLAVVRPHMNGVGGDAFALFHDGESGEVTALNASGRAAAGATPQFFRDRDLERMPQSGPLAVTVPGAVSAWAAALERYGTLSLAQALAPAIRLADEGFAVTHTLAEDLEDALRLNDAGQAIYAPGGEPLGAGEILRNPALAASLRALARDGPPALYGGALGEALARFLEEEGSPLRLADFQAHTADWTEPVSMDFRGRTVHTVPPNSQGMVLLQILGLAEARGIGDGRGLDEARGLLDPDLLHTLVEAKKLAFADRDRWVADPEAAPAPLDRLLDREYLAERAGAIGDHAASRVTPGFGDPSGDDPAQGDGDTVYLIAVDTDGNAVSWIQSLFSSFGSGLVEPETGIVLQNRGGGFTLDEGHPNQIAPGKRPFHTLMATLVTGRDGAFEMALGTPGGHGQAQTVSQALVQMLVFEASPQQAAEIPRFRSTEGIALSVEDRIPRGVRDALEARGHELNAVEGWTAFFGNLHVIRREPNGVLRTGADMRREGAAMAW
jgi:gamma-glutamyltranspeptidase / glutathione hydrolase